MARRGPAGQGSIFWHKGAKRWCAELYLFTHVFPDLRVKRVFWRDYADQQSALVQPLAQAVIAKKKLIKKARERLAVGPQTVASYLWVWHAGLARLGLASGTITNRATAIRRLEPHIGSVPLVDLTADQVRAAFEALALRGPSGRPLRAGTLGETHRTLMLALSQAKLAENPAAAVERPKGGRRVMQTLNQAQVEQLWLADADGWCLHLWVFLLLTGVRVSEALGLQAGDVDLAAGTVVIRQQLGAAAGKGPVLKPTKTAKGRRTIHLPARAIVALTEQLERRKSLPDPDGLDLVFTDERGRGLRPGAVRLRFHAALKAAGLPRVRVHDCRHTCASLLLLRNVHPKIVQELLGHSSIAITLDTYSHFLPQMSGAAAEQFDVLFPAA